MKQIKNDSKESFIEMVKRMDEEDHGKMTKQEWEDLKDKWMKVFDNIKHKEKNPLLLSYEDIQKLY